ncbi:MAG: response regulator transcription factor [Miniphocaeibacter sp.]|uniref:response regulator transcription factor n=1 Tax=Miniphocaeibacter sp. TaxID=3100973 RepID=UPI00185E30CE|nr:response regulator transcription factor [Gallicola sp.]
MKKRILIIEDERDLANMIKIYLHKEQYQVEVCDDGNYAISVVENFNPDMILLDLMLPGKDGLEILREIRTKLILPVIIISAKETESDRILGLKLGADDYLTKPFSIKELVVRVATLFRRIDTYQHLKDIQRQFQYDDIFIDFSARLVKKQQAIVSLTAKEFDLLAYLLKHPKQVMSKEQLYDNVWGINKYGDINTVAIHIQKIREKLGKYNNISTVRGVGYRFDGELE